MASWPNCRHASDKELECLVRVLPREPRIVAGVALLFVDALGLLGVHDLPVEARLAGEDRHLRQARRLRDGKGVDRLEVVLVGIEEGLVDLGATKTIDDRDPDAVIEDLDRLVGRALGLQRASGLGAGSAQEQGVEKE